MSCQCTGQPLGPGGQGTGAASCWGRLFPLAWPSPEHPLWCRVLRVFEVSSELRCWTMFASVPFLMAPSGISWKSSCLHWAASPERQDRKGMCASPVTARDWGGQPQGPARWAAVHPQEGAVLGELGAAHQYHHLEACGLLLSHCFHFLHPREGSPGRAQVGAGQGSASTSADVTSAVPLSPQQPQNPS